MVTFPEQYVQEVVGKFIHNVYDLEILVHRQLIKYADAHVKLKLQFAL